MDQTKLLSWYIFYVSMYACTSVLRTNDKKYQEETIYPRNQKLQVELDRLNAINLP